jgi:NitT/TauT family transport system permease protein
VISLPKRAIGTSLQTAKVHIETADVFAISLLIIALSFVLELLLSALFKNCMKWREKDA